MRRFLFTALMLLSCAAPARAQVYNASVFDCHPDGFTLQRNGNGFVLYGALNTVIPGYSYDIAPVTGIGDGNGETTLTLVPPGGDVATRLSSVSLGRFFMSDAFPVSHLIVHIHGDSRYPGPVEIECFQHGGSQ